MLGDDGESGEGVVVSIGSDNEDAQDGDDVRDGEDGEDNEDEEDGEDDEDGEDSKDGEDGENGKDREDGKDGEDGEDEEDAFKGHKSQTEDEFCSDSDIKDNRSKISRVIRGEAFKRILGQQIEFKKNQIHESVYSLKAALKDYAIQERVAFKRVKNDKDKQIYTCRGEGCPWRIYARLMIDKLSMKIRSYNDKYECHRVRKNEEAKVK